MNVSLLELGQWLESQYLETLLFHNFIQSQLGGYQSLQEADYSLWVNGYLGVPLGHLGTVNPELALGCWYHGGWNTQWMLDKDFLDDRWMDGYIDNGLTNEPVKE